LEARQICSHSAGVTKTIYSEQSRCLQSRIVSLREKAGLTQRELAQKLRRERSLVGRLELGERRLDIVEFYWVCKACDADPEKEARALMRQLKKIEASSP